MSRALTRQQILNWRDGWSFSDRALVEHALDLLPEGDYYEPVSKSYAAARVAGRVAVYIAPGYLYWPRGQWSVDVDPHRVPQGISTDEQDTWYALSTFQQRGTSRPSFEELKAPCPACFMIPSVSGACDCD